MQHESVESCLDESHSLPAPVDLVMDHPFQQPALESAAEDRESKGIDELSHRSIEEMQPVPDAICGLLSEAFPHIDAFLKHYDLRVKRYCDAHGIQSTFRDMILVRLTEEMLRTLHLGPRSTLRLGSLDGVEISYEQVLFFMGYRKQKSYQNALSDLRTIYQAYNHCSKLPPIPNCVAETLPAQKDNRGILRVLFEENAIATLEACIQDSLSPVAYTTVKETGRENLRKISQEFIPGRAKDAGDVGKRRSTERVGLPVLQEVKQCKSLARFSHSRFAERDVILKGMVSQTMGLSDDVSALISRLASG